jgi:glycyl-tRNA synthetase alpha chain
MSSSPLTFQQLLRALDDFWAARGCAILQPWDMEVGAGTSHPATFLRSLGPEPWNAAYVQASRRPADSRYARNPMRVQHYYQYQVVLKPSPQNVVDLYLESLAALGIDSTKHDIKLTEDDWENPSIGASGVGWQVELDGNEISQFTFFQQCGGIECRPVTAELTYGPERLACLLQDVNSIWELRWSEGLTYAELDRQAEVENSVYNLELADIDLLLKLFGMYEAEAGRVIERGLVAPAYDLTLKCSHTFNLLDARGAVSVTERPGYIERVRELAKRCASTWVAQREELGWPLLPAAERAALLGAEGNGKAMAAVPEAKAATA